MSKTGTDPNKILMGDLKPELAAKADKLSSKFAPKPRRAEASAPVAETVAAPVAAKKTAESKAEEQTAKPKAQAKATKASTSAAAETSADEPLVQMNIRIPVSLKRDIDKIVFEKKYAGEDVNIKSLVSQWIQESVKKELRKNG